MRPLIALCLTVTTPVLLTATSLAQTVHVPADYATIQAAINSGATLVYVAQGTYPETLLVQSVVTLLPEPPANPMAAVPFPVVAGMSIRRDETVERHLYVRGFHFTGRVFQQNSNAGWAWTTIEGCKLDAGFQTSGSSGPGETIQIRSCVITGDVFLYAYGADFSGNMVWKGQARVHSNGLGAVIRDNLVVGPSGAGLLSTSGDSPGFVTGNIVSGVTTGYTLASGTASDNVAEDCGRGYTVGGAPWGTQGRFHMNIARRCGIGFDLVDRRGLQEVIGNQVDSALTVGIHAGSGVTALVQANVVQASGSHGIWVEGYFAPTANTVTYSGGDGIRSTESPEWNVVGHSAGHGIVAQGARHNTVFRNGGNGLELSESGWSAPESTTHNIAYGNGGFGLHWSGAAPLPLGCNDWFGNFAGATSGIAPAGTDLALDPLFCNLPANDVTLSSGSPLLSPSGCGGIGALGMGCTTTVDVPPATERVARFAVIPNPTRGETAFRWANAAAPCQLEVFDIAGALRWSANVPAGIGALRWSGEDLSHRALPGGIYFVRRTSADTQEQARLVLSR